MGSCGFVGLVMKKIIIIVVALIVVLGAGGGGLFFVGMLDEPLGFRKT